VAGLGLACQRSAWIPAFAGMTEEMQCLSSGRMGLRSVPAQRASSASPVPHIGACRGAKPRCVYIVLPLFANGAVSSRNREVYYLQVSPSTIQS